MTAFEITRVFTDLSYQPNFKTFAAHRKMDEKTSQYYRSHATELTKRYDAVVSSVSRYFRVAFTEGARLLDVGAGSGRDMAMLQSMGYDVYGVEPCDEMLAQAEANHPELASRLAIGQLPDLGNPLGVISMGFCVLRS